MNTLKTIQKTYNIFETLTKIGMILSFVWAGIILVGLMFGIAWQLGANIVGFPVDYALKLTETGAIFEMIGALMGDFVPALTDGLLFLFANRYLKQELADGTPFTMSGAEQVKNLGIKTIVMPLVAIIVSAVIYECFDVTRLNSWDNGAAVVLGIALILFSMILRHGAELREMSSRE